jgi:hypothetical protein
MKISMIHALDILKLEKKQLEDCLSNWDCSHYPEAKKIRDEKLTSCIIAITCINLVINGINPLNNGAFENYKL